MGRRRARVRHFSPRVHEIREARRRHPCTFVRLSNGASMRAQCDGRPETLAALRELGEAALERMRAEASA